MSNRELGDLRLGVAVTVKAGVCTGFTLVPVKLDPDERRTISPAAAANGTPGHFVVAGLNETIASRFDVDRNILLFHGGATGLRLAAKFPCSQDARVCVVNETTIFVASE